MTEAKRKLEEAKERSERLIGEQSQVVSALNQAMGELSEGNLKVRINERFPNEYEPLRLDFNEAVSTLDAAIGETLESADKIRQDVDAVSEKNDAFATRTTQQFATIEATSSAISQLSASVASAADRAESAKSVVIEAHDRASSSEQIVSDTVDAMGSIEQSSEQISRIIGVIDEIAFQTNLLALNAGVEAARAGDAGRGFAVVASEVRELAQRSSNAASEISNLITASRAHVQNGVSLVGKTGEALTEIAGTFRSATDQVSAIAVSTKEQATGISEINKAMSEFEKATQQNALMLEQAVKASQELRWQADELEKATSSFACSDRDAKNQEQYIAFKGHRRLGASPRG